jgi:hypothetical protein
LGVFERFVSQLPHKKSLPEIEKALVFKNEFL